MEVSGLGDIDGDSDGCGVITMTMMLLAMMERVGVMFVVTYHNILEYFK